MTIIAILLLAAMGLSLVFLIRSFLRYQETRGKRPAGEDYMHDDDDGE